jgi:pyrroloquinoline quinone biosynthesis protein B
VIVRVLGSAAGGGVPQWNCACVNCDAARTGRGPKRSQSSFAFSTDGGRYWLVNASPDIASQIESQPDLQPRAGRGTPIAGMLFTDANVDHLGGLAVTRQAGEHAFDIYSTATVRAIACAQPAFAAFAADPHCWHVVAPGERFRLDDRLDVTAIAIEGTTPGYAGRERRSDAVVGYMVCDSQTGRSVLFAPVFSDVDRTLLAAASAADIAFFDGSFWSDDELTGVGVEKSARALGHAPIGGPGGSLVVLAGIASKGRRFFAHVNNTNPILDPASDAFAEISKRGFEVAADGLEIRL